MTRPHPPRVGFIGAGKAGTALGRYFAAYAVPPAGFASRTFEHARAAAQASASEAFASIDELLAACDIAVIAVDDASIPAVWDEIRRCTGPRPRIVCHCSGARTVRVFEGAHDAGIDVCSCHPLCALPYGVALDAVREAVFALEGDEPAVRALEALLAACGTRTVRIDPARKRAYHAAAACASNLVVALAAQAEAVMRACGLDADAAHAGISALMGATGRSLAERGCDDALTGPVERNDVHTVAAHLDALEGDALIAYRALSRTLLPIAARKHPARDWTAMRALLAERNAPKPPAPKEEAPMKQTVVTFQRAKEEGRKISMLTAYDYSTAKLVDEAGIDGILVGDSLGNVVLGYEDTVSVTMEDMIHHGAAVARGAHDALVVIDMPFMSYQTSAYDAVVNAGRLMKEGRGDCVKLEGGVEMADRIRAIVAAGIPVMAHIGLTPQSINAFGGFKVQGKTEQAARRILEDAEAVEAAGAFAVVLEAVPAPLAALVTERVSIPTIGIGAGARCDGQILVYQDLVGMFSDFTPKFVKRYASVGQAMKEAFARYADEVRSGAFPDEGHAYGIDEDVIEKLY